MLLTLVTTSVPAVRLEDTNHDERDRKVPQWWWTATIRLVNIGVAEQVRRRTHKFCMGSA